MQEPMKHNIYYSPEARRDMDEIWDYIESELSNPIAAEKVVSRIMDAVDQLTDFPLIGVPLLSVTNVDSDYRFLTSGNYMVFYRVYAGEVYIDRVLYSRRDYLRILFGDTAVETDTIE